MHYRGLAKDRVFQRKIISWGSLKPSFLVPLASLPRHRICSANRSTMLSANRGWIGTGVQRHTGVVEEITWRAVKIRTFQNHIVLISNSTAAREPIEVCPRENLNARLVFFNTLFSDSPAKTIHVVREAVREADNVSQKVTPIVRIRNLGESGVDYEVKYWLDDYAKYNDTDALVRQRIWYAFRRAGLTFAYPTRTLLVERKAKTGAADGDGGAIIERLAAVDIFAPLSAEETAMLAQAATSHVFAPGETVIRAGDPGSSMFVVHNGRVSVQVSESGRARTVATLSRSTTGSRSTTPCSSSSPMSRRSASASR